MMGEPIAMLMFILYFGGEICGALKAYTESKQSEANERRKGGAV